MVGNKIDIGMNTYDLEDEAGILDMSPHELGPKYAFLMEFPSTDMAVQQAEEQQEIVGGENAEETNATPEAAANVAADPTKGPLYERLRLFGEELDLIVEDQMYEYVYDYVFEVLQFKREVVQYQDLTDASVMLLHKLVRVMYMAPDHPELGTELKLTLIEEYIIPELPELTLQMERIWQHLLIAVDKKKILRSKGKVSKLLGASDD